MFILFLAFTLNLLKIYLSREALDMFFALCEYFEINFSLSDTKKGYEYEMAVDKITLNYITQVNVLTMKLVLTN